MRWSRELRIARRSLRTAVKAVAAMAGSRTNLPAGLRSRALTPPANPRTSPGLTEVTDFGSNPGRLSMLVYVPNVAPAPNAALIVLLHGCGQAAASFSRDTGWIALADRLGIPLVLPEQADANNRGRCFNWFRPLHTGRGLGEALSVRQMVAVATQRFQCDPSRVFIAGLSAGGAMTAALLAAYPDVFAAGAVVAGLPVGAANGTVEALARMAEAGPRRTREAWAQQVRNAAPVGFVGPWPRISIWHGSADDVVGRLPHLAHAADRDPRIELVASAERRTLRRSHLPTTASMTCFAIGAATVPPKPPRWFSTTTAIAT